mmetsp:Transcript_502/g.820  ORF Transcript_502/g.820 Transcript_502/m.820 type:complete len:431 (+) Transcript_502:147-1439(+)|eukprot:CAMPEP_0113643978 /NCGR_PEP_ID=MMETSP0017_2-20120614/23138_1 /TAXON_ID=2856 /ORGANISM="Cylindrotheca closterium" /LENGTH=430 /DNA_ID=CAMNT_0000555549 /DNA_START=54 /DNA_END=1346 /DNA_ORIENTATION=- /assembly_acc=CAM_ASM_000147
MKNEMKHDPDACKKLLEECEMFEKVPPSGLSKLVNKMRYRVFGRDEIIHKQDDPVDKFFLLESGDLLRTRHDPETDRTHTVEFAIRANSIGTMRVLGATPASTTVRCVSDSCKLFEMQRKDLIRVLRRDPDISMRIIEGLSSEVRKSSRKYQTPLLQLKQTEVNVTAVSIAAGIECYYRSMMNSFLNARLTGVTSELFPNMHIQVPSRIFYICGFKVLRASFDKYINPNDFEHPTAVRWSAVLSPGIIMTPISSVLEASNAGHMNSEPMMKRWMRGVVPRAGREIVFGVGLNQLSDYFEERVEPFFPDNAIAANAAGSLLAGMVSGYFSHVPHNLSTLKLLEPQKSYRELNTIFIDRSVPPAVERMIGQWPPLGQSIARPLFAYVFPRGLLIRTTQIIGSFMILNGTINLLQMKEHEKFERKWLLTTTNR